MTQHKAYWINTSVDLWICSVHQVLVCCFGAETWRFLPICLFSLWRNFKLFLPAILNGIQIMVSRSSASVIITSSYRSLSLASLLGFSTGKCYECCKWSLQYGEPQLWPVLMSSVNVWLTNIPLVLKWPMKQLLNSNQCSFLRVPVSSRVCVLALTNWKEHIFAAFD